MDNRLLAAAVLLAASLGLRAATPEPFVVHEWGTFTSVQGGSGKQVEWAPTINTDLPSFVYSREIRNGGLKNVTLLDSGGKGSVSGFVRMETPVLYFYSDAERDVNVRVLFPTGRITEWYPQAARIGPYMTKVKSQMAAANESAIEWQGVKILPRDTQEMTASRLIRDRAASSQADHYYAARDTDANILRVSAPGARAEHEKDLFYRGVGFSEAPLAVKLDADEQVLTLTTTSAEPVTDVFVLTVQRGMMRYQKVDSVTSAQNATLQFDAKPFAPFEQARKQLMSEMVSALEHHGLYAKEARAMVATWKDQWFTEEGTRALYLLPRAWTDRTLPLNISPRPERVVRVMVGRAELIAPSRARALQEQIMAYAHGDPDARNQAVAATRELRLGRFSPPAIKIALGPQPDPNVFNLAFELANKVARADFAAAHVTQSVSTSR